jgi:hypothetical protein
MNRYFDRQMEHPLYRYFERQMEQTKKMEQPMLRQMQMAKTMQMEQMMQMEQPMVRQMQMERQIQMEQTLARHRHRHHPLVPVSEPLKP